MAAPTDNHFGPLKYQTWTLRVPIHCEGCQKKVKKILQKIDGVFLTTVDAQQHKVTVTGNIEAQTLLQRLSKSGKPAELWADKSVKTENVLDAQSNAKEKNKATKENDEKKGTKNQKAKGNTNEGGQRKEKKSAENHAKTLDGGDNSDKAPPSNGDKPLPLDDGVSAAQIVGKSDGRNTGQKKKKSKGNNGNAGHDVKLVAPPSTASPPPSVSLSEAAVPETPALAPTSPAPAYVPSELPPTELPAQAPAPEPLPVRAPVYGFSGHPLHLGNPIDPINLGPSNNFGLHHRRIDNFGPPNQQEYMYPPALYQPPQLGVSYSMAKPGSSTSYYAPPYYAYEYPQYPMMHIRPSLMSNPINEVHDDDHYYNDNASQCRIM